MASTTSTTTNTTTTTRISELEIQLSRALERESSTLDQLQAAQAKNEALHQLLDKKDHFLRSTKFVLRLRESHITRLQQQQKSSKNNNNTPTTTYEQDLLEEIDVLKKQLLHHPEITRLSMENNDLKEIMNSKFKEMENINKIDSLTQQVRELVSENKILLQEKNQLQLNNQNNKMKTPIKQNNNNNIDTSSTPYLERQKLKEQMEFNQIQWDKDRNELELQYQVLHQKNIQLQSDYDVLKSNSDKLNQSLHDIHVLHENEINQLTLSNENMVKLLKNSHTIEINQLKNDNNRKTDDMIMEITKSIEELEQEKNSVNGERMKLVSELFEKNEEINRLKLELESSQLSNKRMTEVFISTPLRSEQVRNEQDTSMTLEDGPIKFDLAGEESKVIKELKSELESLQLELSTKIELLQNIEIDKQSLLDEIETLKQTIISNIEKNNDADNILLKEKNQEINSLKSKLDNMCEEITEIETNYQTQIRTLNNQISTNNETIQKKEQEIQQIQKAKEMELVESRSKLMDDMEEKQSKLAASLKLDYDNNIHLLKKEIVKITLQPKLDENLIEKYQELKLDYDDLVNQHEKCQDTIGRQFDEIFSLNRRLKNFTGPKYRLEEDIIVISSDEEDEVDNNNNDNNNNNNVQSIKEEEKDIESIDFSKIEIKKESMELNN